MDARPASRRKAPHKQRARVAEPGPTAEDAAPDDSALADTADSEQWLPVEYETRAAHDALPWQDSALDLSRVNAPEEGFCGLEELPSGSYDIERTTAGAIVIRVRKPAGSRAAAAAPAAPMEDASPETAVPAAAAGGKRKRDAGADGASSVGTGRGRSGRPTPAPASFAPADAALALAPEDVAAEWAPLGLHPLLLSALCRLGFARPTRIQRDAVSGRAGGAVVCGGWAGMTIFCTLV